MNPLRACWSGGFRGRVAEKNDIAFIWRERIIEMTHTILIPGAQYWAPARQVGLWDSGQSLLVSEGLPRRDDLGARLRDGLLKTLHIPVRQAQASRSRRRMVTPRGWSPDEQTRREAEREVEDLWGKPRSCQQHLLSQLGAHAGEPAQRGPGSPASASTSRQTESSEKPS